MRGIDKTIPHIYWSSNKKAWVVATIFHNWFATILNQRSKIRRPSSSKRKSTFLPPNTLILQPLDQCIMKTIKSYYIRGTFELRLENFEYNPDMRCVKISLV